MGATRSYSYSYSYSYSGPPAYPLEDEYRPDGLSTRTSPGGRHAVVLVIVIVIVLGSRGIPLEDENRPLRG